MLSSIVGCRQAKYVPDDYYLLNENKVRYTVSADSSTRWHKEHKLLDEGDIEDLIRPETNSGLKLWIYNRIDSARYSKQLKKKRLKYQRKNEKRKAKVEHKNQKRIEKAREKGKTHYKKKTFHPKTVRLGWRHWVITHWGQEPVILDTAKVSKSKQQMEVYLSQRGFKYGEVRDSIVYNEKKQKAYVTYYIESGEPYRINKIRFDPNRKGSALEYQYNRMVRKEGTDLKEGNLLDEDDLDDERDHYTKFLKDNAYFGFSKNYVNFIVDTTIGDFKADVIIYVKDKRVPNPNNPDTTMTVPHKVYYVDEITYKLHNPDSLSFIDWEGYKQRCRDLGYTYPYQIDGHYALLDTMFIVDTVVNVRRVNLNKDIRKKYDVGLFEKFNDTVVSHKGYFIYNEEPIVQPSLLDKQNFLEHTDLSRDERNYAKDYYIDRSFKSLLRLDVFSQIKPDLHISPDDPLGYYCDITYDLVPAPKQRFTVEPRATNTASILGISGLISYTNKNINRAANKLKVSLEGGLQSQPLFVTEGQEGNRFGFRGLNTFEIGPELSYEIPRFYPMTKKMAETISKRAFPSTKLTALYNFQRRPEFERHVAEMSYKWSFSSPNQTQIFTVTPLRFNYIFLNKQPEFDATLNATNDQFLINSYSDFFSLGVLNIRHEYNNQKLKRIKRRFNKDHAITNTIELTAAGLVMNTVEALVLAGKNGQSFGDVFNEEGKLLFKVPYAQYAKLENTFIFNQVITKKHRMVYRLNMGVGIPYGNGFALPYTQSFVAGGSNDIRAFDARTMAPGGTQTWNQQNSTDTQIGDMKLMLNLEWRFVISGQWNGALFMDMGNIWKLQSEDPNDPGLFSFSDFYRQVAIGTGFGIRYDLTFLILRLDMSWALHNPYLPAGSRWWLADNGGKEQYDLSHKVNAAGVKLDYDLPHGLNFNIGIGYPF